MQWFTQNVESTVQLTEAAGLDGKKKIPQIANDCFINTTQPMGPWLLG